MGTRGATRSCAITTSRLFLRCLTSTARRATGSHAIRASSKYGAVDAGIEPVVSRQVTPVEGRQHVAVQCLNNGYLHL